MKIFKSYFKILILTLSILVVFLTFSYTLNLNFKNNQTKLNLFNNTSYTSLSNTPYSCENLSNPKFDNANFSLLSKTKLEQKETLSTKQDWYGRVFDKNVYLYSSPNSDSIANAYFSIEPTYFVKLIESANDKFYKAQYLDIIGYIKKNEVQVTSTTPQKPFLANINFRIYSEISQPMRTIPSTSGGSSSQVCYLPYFCKDALYYGKIEGESAIPGRTNIWYFCRYYSDQAYYGYIYSDGCDQMTSYTKNEEIVDYVDSPNFEQIKVSAPLTIIDEKDKSYGLIIALISIPVGIFLVMVIRSQLILKYNKKEKAKEIKLFFDS